MKFFADEGLDATLVKQLRDAGYDVTYAAEEYVSLLDSSLLEIARKEERILITKDKDFGELAIRSGQQNAGIILIRIERLNNHENCLLVLNAFEKYKDDLPNNFTVIQEDKIRIRKL